QATGRFARLPRIGNARSRPRYETSKRGLISTILAMSDESSICGGKTRVANRSPDGSRLYERRNNDRRSQHSEPQTGGLLEDEGAGGLFAVSASLRPPRARPSTLGFC